MSRRRRTSMNHHQPVHWPLSFPPSPLSPLFPPVHSTSSQGQHSHITHLTYTYIQTSYMHTSIATCAQSRNHRRWTGGEDRTRQRATKEESNNRKTEGRKKGRGEKGYMYIYRSRVMHCASGGCHGAVIGDSRITRISSMFWLYLSDHSTPFISFHSTHFILFI